MRGRGCVRVRLPPPRAAARAPVRAEPRSGASPTHGIPRDVCVCVCNSAACVPPKFLTTAQLSARRTLHLKNFPVSEVQIPGVELLLRRNQLYVTRGRT